MCFKAQEDTFSNKKLKAKRVKLNAFTSANNFPALQGHTTCKQKKAETVESQYKFTWKCYMVKPMTYFPLFFSWKERIVFGSNLKC